MKLGMSYYCVEYDRGMEVTGGVMRSFAWVLVPYCAGTESDSRPCSHLNALPVYAKPEPDNS